MAHLEHIGIAVRDATAVAKVYADLLGLTPYKKETVTSEHVRTHFIQAGQTKLELLEAIDPASAIASFLDKRGEGLHHLAFEVDQLSDAIERLQALGYQPLNPTPKPGADSKQIVFLHPKQTHRVLIELCERRDTPLPAHPIPYANGTLHTYRLGSHEGIPLLALHSDQGTVQSELAVLLNHLEKHVSVITFDADSHTDIVDQINVVLDYFAIPIAHLWGFSTSGVSALQYAIQQPNRTAKLILHAPALPTPKPSGLNDSIDVLVSGYDHDPTVAVTDLVTLMQSHTKSQLAIFPGQTHALSALDLPSYERLIRHFLSA